jgi:opacity protein-like surface antigen
LFLVLLSIAAPNPASAQEPNNTHKLTINGGGGVSLLVGTIGSRLDTGWHATGGVGYNFTRNFSTTVQFTYHELGVSRRTLQEAAVPDGNAHVWSITLDPRISFAPDSRFNPYVVFGGGYFRRTVEFTRPTTQAVNIFDPFFGIFYTAFVPANAVLGQITRDGAGWDAGTGFDFGIGHNGLKIFTEARYVYGGTGSLPTRIVPVTFGLRW